MEVENAGGQLWAISLDVGTSFLRKQRLLAVEVADALTAAQTTKAAGVADGTFCMNVCNLLPWLVPMR